MSSQWFRFYDEALNDPKVQKLSAVLFKVWVNLLCLSSKNKGILPSIDDIVFSLRIDKKTMMKQLKELVECGLIDEVNGHFSPHNWNSRQFKSDSSNERVRKHREEERKRKCNVTHTLHETPPETETEQIKNVCLNTTTPVANNKGLSTDLSTIAVDNSVNPLNNNDIEVRPPPDSGLEDLNFNDLAVCFDVCCALLGKERLDELDREYLMDWHQRYDMRQLIEAIRNDLAIRVRQKKPTNSLRYFAYLTQKMPVRSG